MAGKVRKFELGKSGNFLWNTGGVGMLAGDDIFSPGQDQIDHAREIGSEFFLAGGVAPGSVTAGAFNFTEVAEFARGGDEDVIHEDGGVAFDAEFIGELGSSEVFCDKSDLAGVLGGDILDQQTCWVGDISCVGPADERDVHGFAGSLLERWGGLLCREVGGEDVIEDDAGTAPFVSGGS